MARYVSRLGPDPIDVYVGIKLREQRKRTAVSQADLGATVGITFQQIQKYERGKNRISASVLVRLAQALGCSSGDLLPPSDEEAVSAVSLRVMEIIGSVRGAKELTEAFSKIVSEEERDQIVQLVVTLSKRP